MMNLTRVVNVPARSRGSRIEGFSFLQGVTPCKITPSHSHFTTMAHTPLLTAKQNEMRLLHNAISLKAAKAM